MKISELIENLEEMKYQFGDLVVTYIDESVDCYFPIEDLEIKGAGDNKFVGLK